MRKDSSYDIVLRELTKECRSSMGMYASKLHGASHHDRKGVNLSHIEIVNKIQQDCIRICMESARHITFRGSGEEDAIGEILEYNHDEADIEHMINTENIDLFLHLQPLNVNCIKCKDPEWFLFGIHEQLQNGRVNLGPIASGIQGKNELETPLRPTNTNFGIAIRESFP